MTVGGGGSGGGDNVPTNPPPNNTATVGLVTWRPSRSTSSSPGSCNRRRRADAPRIAVATPAGQQMELGALMVAASAAAEGWRVAWFGPNLPASDIVLGVGSIAPDAVAIRLVHQTRDPALHKELEQIGREGAVACWWTGRAGVFTAARKTGSDGSS